MRRGEHREHCERAQPHCGCAGAVLSNSSRLDERDTTPRPARQLADMIAYPALSPDQSRQQFPRKLYDLLQNSNPAIVSWLVDGMSFYVQDDSKGITPRREAKSGARLAAWPAAPPPRSRVLSCSRPIHKTRYSCEDPCPFCSGGRAVAGGRHNFGTRGARTSSPEVEDRARALTLFNLVAGFLKRLYHRKRVKLTI